MLNILRPDALKVDGILKQKMDEVISLSSKINDDVVDSKISMLNGQWLLPNDGSNKWVEPVSILENPVACIKQLDKTLLLAKRIRSKDLIIQLANYTKDIYENIFKENTEEKIIIAEKASIELISYCISLYNLIHKQFLINLANEVNALMPNYVNFIQNMEVVKPSNPNVPEGTPENESTIKFYAERHELAHGEKVADCVKAAVLNFKCSGLARTTEAALRGLKLLDKYHGTIHGAYTANDYLAGRCPNIPVNINAASKFFVALQSLFCATDDLSVADRMETIACNLLPAYINENKIQIMQTTNQCDIGKRVRPWPYAEVTTCKFFNVNEKLREYKNFLDAANALRSTIWLKKNGKGIALIFPFESTVLYNVDGVPVQLTLKGNYPFGEDMEITINTKDEVAFPLYIRIPGYTAGATIAVNKEAAQPAVTGSYYVISRNFKKGDKIYIKFPIAIKINKFYRRSYAVFKGPIIMAYPQDSKKKCYENLALDLETTPNLVDENSQLIKANVFRFDGKYDCNCKVPLMPECDTTNHESIELKPYANCLNRLAQFATIQIDEGKNEA
ncbi:MAG: hypothetical protein GYA87_06285 [Christensenellaceae bacterium]|nr:hypothetical protein [Christensenellaceae bacterium]